MNTYTRLLIGTKVMYYADRLRDWQEGKRVSPVTVDMALTRTCNYRCQYCYGQLQENTSAYSRIPWTALINFVDDCAKLDVRGVSLVSDGESTCHPKYADFISYARSRGLAVALASHGANFTEPALRQIIPCLTYLRFNISAGEANRYAEIHGVYPYKFYEVCGRIRDALRVRNELDSKCTIGMQMVLRPCDGDQILPLARLAVNLGVDYLVIKHCSDDEDGSLGVDYDSYESLGLSFCEAEKLSNAHTQIVVKWSKLAEGANRSYSRCYGPPFILQLSGSGLVAPCGMLFNDKYKKYHIGNICESRFSDIVASDRYWEVMHELASDSFDARSMCGCLCLQHETNKYLNALVSGRDVPEPEDTAPEHSEFI